MGNKRNKIIIVILIIIILICSFFIISQNDIGEKVTTGIDETLVEGENEKEKESEKESEGEVDTYVEENNTSQNSTDSEETTFLEDSTTSDNATNSNEKVTSNKSGMTEKTTTLKESTTSNRGTNVDEKPSSEETTSSNKPTTKEETTTSDRTTNKEETTTSKKPVIQEETETTKISGFNIILNAPETAKVGTSFNVSIATSECAHIEWYINGEYDSSLEKKINPKGTMKFSKAGIYRITVIGYNEDWSKNVSDSKAVRIYNDESELYGNAKEHDRAMYSWNHDFIYKENEAKLQKVMEKTGCNILYQEVASNASTSDVAAFLKRRGENNQIVYYLCGNATWGIEKGETSMLKQVEKAVAYNNASGKYKFVGIQFDVEPYCLEDFEENADKYMAQYVENCKLAYQAAHNAGLLVEICIPYWWDSSYGYYDELEDLVANACDSVAVMNYYKKQKEAEHIENEVALCKKYNKRIINITETIPPGLHGLTENNTYYNDGIDAIEEMWNTLDAYFQYDKLGYSYHYLDVIIELLG